MSKAPVTSRRGDAITSIEDWGRLAGPASATHWKEGRSAYELARWWIEGDGEEAVLALLREHFDSPHIHTAVPEAQTAFDEWPGGTRNHDLLLACTDGTGPLVVGVEAKADETYGQTVAAYRAAAEKRPDSGESTNAPQRLEGLTRNLAGSTPDEDPALRPLRFQLFSALAGTIAAASAEGAKRAVLLIVELVTDATSEELRVANHADLAAFAKRVFELEIPDHGDWLVRGPARSTGGHEARVWLGHMAVQP